MNVLVAISGYAGDAHQIEQNWPCYKHHGFPILVLSPADAPITSVADQTAHCQWFGCRQWAGDLSLQRHRLFLEALLTFPQEYFLFHDADSVCLSPKLPDYLFQERASFANVVQDLNTGASHLEKVAMQPPYFFHRDVVRAMLACVPAESYYGPVTGDPIPTSAIDHYHWQLTAACGYSRRSFPDGASWETASEIGIHEMSRVVREEGKVFIHSVKTQSALDRLMGEHATYRRRTGT